MVSILNKLYYETLDQQMVISEYNVPSMLNKGNSTLEGFEGGGGTVRNLW